MDDELRYKLNHTRHCLRGFNLIEILVVVALIALLLSILLPSLERSRAQARSVLCASNLSAIGRSLTSYTTVHREGIPGSPITTGRWHAEQTNASLADSWAPNEAGFNRFVAEWMDYATPLRVEMYGAKIVARPQDAAQAISVRSDLFLNATEGVFHCPENDLIIPAYPDATLYPAIRAPSYLTMWPMMKGGPAIHKQGLGNPAINSYAIDETTFGGDVEIVPPANYVPRLDRVGKSLSMKVYLADGARYFGPECDVTIDCDTGFWDYNTNAADSKGAFSATPPAVRNFDEDGTESREYTVARQYSYRHGKNNRINALFFDGHVEGLRVDVSQKTTDGGGFGGKAVQPKYYWPSRSRVHNSAGLHLDSFTNGTILP